MEYLSTIKVGIIGLGYVGLPVAVAIGKKFKDSVGFDLSLDRINSLNNNIDKNKDLESSELIESKIRYTTNEKDLKGCNFFIVAVPTPIDEDKRPDLTPLKLASEIVARNISVGATVVYESTVYPGVTEEFCGPIIESISGLKQKLDFSLGYSPERINPGDKEHTLERIIKVVSGDTEKSLELISKVYSAIITAGVYKASCIKVAEAAKVIENTQRDLNISLMNELALIFDKLNISTNEVLEAAGTKWNFLKFSPGLVGGHCIGVDPYYLTTKAEQLGIIPQVILAGRRINDGMGVFIAQKMIKLLIKNGTQIKGAKVGILGLTFKENVSDIRNSRVPDIINELKEYGVDIIVTDQYADPKEVLHEFNLNISPIEELTNLDGLIVAVSHSSYKNYLKNEVTKIMKKDSVLVDVKGIVVPSSLPKNTTYWCL